jgi:hypothetical protein
VARPERLNCIVEADGFSRSAFGGSLPATAQLPALRSDDDADRDASRGELVGKLLQCSLLGGVFDDAWNRLIGLLASPIRRQSRGADLSGNQ